MKPDISVTEWRDPWRVLHGWHRHVIGAAITAEINADPVESAALRRALRAADAGEGRVRRRRKSGLGESA